MEPTTGIRKLVAVAALAGAMAATPLVTTSASADPWGRHGGYYGGGYGQGYGHGHGRHGGYWGGAAAAGLLGGLALGALASQGGYYGGSPAYGYGGCYIVRDPVTDDWGNIVYYQRVRVCQ